MEFRGFPVHDSTKAVRGTQGWDDTTGAVSMPLYLSATFRHPSLGQTTGWDYSRQGNPTRRELEQTVAALENGVAGFAFTTGMSAVAAILDLLQAGDHVVFSEDLYGGTYRFAVELASRHGLTCTFADSRKLSLVEEALTERTKLLFIESPSNPMMRISDLRSLSRLCRERNILLAVDNTFLTPLVQKPLDLGADLVVHSGTKYLAGHNDVLAGFVVTSHPDLAERLTLIAKTSGAVLSPFDSWLVLRGLKTLDLRLERQQRNAIRLAGFLTVHPRVREVYFPGLETHEGHALHRSQANGPGAMVSFRVDHPSLVGQVLEKVRLIIFAESLGGVETLLTFPQAQTHASIPEDLRRRLGVDDTLMRLSVGIEHIEDLEADLAQALR